MPVESGRKKLSKFQREVLESIAEGTALHVPFSVLTPLSDGGWIEYTETFSGYSTVVLTELGWTAVMGDKEA